MKKKKQKKQPKKKEPEVEKESEFMTHVKKYIEEHREALEKIGRL